MLKEIFYESGNFLLYKCDNTLLSKLNGQNTVYRCKRSGYIDKQLYITSELFTPFGISQKLTDEQIYKFLCKFHGVKSLDFNTTVDIKCCDKLLSKQFSIEQSMPILFVQQQFFMGDCLIGIANSYVNTSIQKFIIENI